jgi:hypothetical protein
MQPVSYTKFCATGVADQSLCLITSEDAGPGPMWFVEDVTIQRMRDDGCRVGHVSSFLCGRWIYGPPSSAKNPALLREDPHPIPQAPHFIEVHTSTGKGGGVSDDVLIAVEYLKKVAAPSRHFHFDTCLSSWSRTLQLIDIWWLCMCCISPPELPMEPVQRTARTFSLMQSTMPCISVPELCSQN